MVKNVDPLLIIIWSHDYFVLLLYFKTDKCDFNPQVV